MAPLVRVLFVSTLLNSEGVTDRVSSDASVVSPQDATPESAFSSLELLDQVQADLAAELKPAAPGIANRAGLQRLSILMPVFNERWTVGDVLNRINATPISIAKEIIVIDDGSTDGSADYVATLCRQMPGLRLIRQPRNAGKGSAIRRGIEEMTGDVAVIQDADLEYSPDDLPALLQPLLDDQADAVFGSRFSGSSRRCLPFWHAQINRALTLASNMVTNTNLTDMETGYKVVRADILRELNLSSRSFTLEPEITCRLAQWGARIVERPITYQGRSFEEGKKIRARDGIKAIATLLRCRLVQRNFTEYPEDAAQRSLRHAHRFHQSMVDMASPYLGERLLDAGAGAGNISGLLLKRPRLVLADINPHHVRRLKQRFANRSNVRIEHADLTDRSIVDTFADEQLDSILAANTLQQLGPDFLVLRNFYKLLPAGGRLVAFVPLDMRLMNSLDNAIGNERRYNAEHLCRLMERAGFEIAASQNFNRLGSAGWWMQGVLGRQGFGSGSVLSFDRLWSLAKGVDRFLPLPAMTAMIVGVKP